MGALMFVGASALFSLIPVNLVAITVHGRPTASIALALNGSLVSLEQGIGALFGGTLTDAFGAAAMGPGGALIAMAGLLLAVFFQRTAAPPEVGKPVAAE